MLLQVQQPRLHQCIAQQGEGLMLVSLALDAGCSCICLTRAGDQAGLFDIPASTQNRQKQCTTGAA